MCHMSRVKCHMSHLTCHNFLFLFLFFFGQSGEAYRWRVCYQRGVPCLVFCIGASICIGWETLFLRYAGFFLIPYLRWKLVISYIYFLIGKIIVLVFLHTLKIIHSWDKVLINSLYPNLILAFAITSTDHSPQTLYLWHNNLLFGIATSFTQNIINNRKYWGSWNSATIHSNIGKKTFGLWQWHIQTKKNKILWIWAQGGGHILNSQIIVKNWVLDGTTQISATLHVREYCWVCEELQLSTG